MRNSPRILSSWFTWIPSGRTISRAWLNIWAASVQWYSDNIRSRSTVRTSLIKNIYQDLIITWLSRLRQEGEFTITSKSTFQRRITSNQHRLPMQLLYSEYLFHISCHSNSCICILFWNTHIHNRICSWLLGSSVEVVIQSLIVDSLTQWVWTYFLKLFENSSLTSRTTELLLLQVPHGRFLNQPNFRL